MNEKSAVLVAKFVQGKSLTEVETARLRTTVSRAELEALATGTGGKAGVSRRLYKLCNILFATKHGPKRPKPAAPAAKGMYPTLTNPVPGAGGKKVVSGGGANGTARRGWRRDA